MFIYTYIHTYIHICIYTYIPLGEEVAHATGVPVDLDLALLDVLAHALLQRLGHHEELVLLVRGLREALEGAGLNDGLAKLDDGVGDLIIC